MKNIILIISFLGLGFHISFGQISTMTGALSSARSATSPNGINIITAENRIDTFNYISAYYEIPEYLKKTKKGIEQIIPDLIKTGTAQLTTEEFKAICLRNKITISADLDQITLTQKNGKIDTAIWLLSRIILNPNFDEDDLIRSRQRQNTELFPPVLSPHAYIKNVAHSAYYGKSHPRGENFSKSDILNISLNDIKKNYASNYLHSKLYISVLSKSESDTIIQFINANFADYQYIEKEITKFNISALPKFNRIYFHQVPDTITGDATYLSLLSPVHEKISESDRLSMQMLNKILGEYKSGRFYKRLIAEEAVAEFVYSDIKNDEFNFSAVFKPTDLDKLLKFYGEEISNIQTDKVTDAELNVAYNILKSEFINDLKQPEKQLEMLLFSAKYDLPTSRYIDYLNDLQDVSSTDIRRVAQKYIQSEPYLGAVLGKEKQVKNEFYAVAESTETVIMHEEKEFEIIPYGFSVKNIIVKYLEKTQPVEPQKGQYLRLKGVYDFGAKKSTVIQEIYRKDKNYLGTYTLVSDSGQIISIKKEARLGNRIWMTDMIDTLEVLSPDYHGIITRSYGFPELEYDYDNIKIEFLELQTIRNSEVYKVKTTYPYNLVRYDYFEKNSALKFKSEFYELTAGNTEKYIQTIEISDYRRIPKTKNSYIPYHKHIITNDYTADFDLIKIDYSYKIPKSAFELRKN